MCEEHQPGPDLGRRPLLALLGLGAVTTACGSSAGDDQRKASAPATAQASPDGGDGALRRGLHQVDGHHRDAREAGRLDRELLEPGGTGLHVVVATDLDHDAIGADLFGEHVLIDAVAVQNGGGL